MLRRCHAILYDTIYMYIYIHTRHTTPYYTILYHTIPYYTMQNRNITYHTIQNRNATLHMNSMNITLHRIEVPPVTVVFSTVSYISYPTLPHHTVAWSYINYIAYTTCPFLPQTSVDRFQEHVEILVAWERPRKHSLLSASQFDLITKASFC